MSLLESKLHSYWMDFNEKNHSIRRQLYVLVLNYVRVAFKKSDFCYEGESMFDSMLMGCSLM